jgi:hypothetical protein
MQQSKLSPTKTRDKNNTTQLYPSPSFPPSVHLPQQLLVDMFGPRELAAEALVALVREASEESLLLGEVTLLPVAQALVHVAYVVREDGCQLEEGRVDCRRGEAVWMSCSRSKRGGR